LAELREKLLQQVAALLAKHGYSRREQSFEHELGDVRWIVHIAIIRHASDFDFTCDFAVRHHVIQDILRPELYSGLSNREFGHTPTVGVELGNYMGVGPKRWTVTSEADLPAAITDLDYYFREHIRYGLETLSSLSELKTALEREDTFARLVSPLQSHRAAIVRAIGQLPRAV
jgi:hypothetical protein